MYDNGSERPIAYASRLLAPAKRNHDADDVRAREQEGRGGREDEGDDDFSLTEPNGDQEDETLLVTDPVQQNQVQPATAHRDQSQHHPIKYTSLYHVHRLFTHNLLRMR